jgi:uncharacterized protein (TIGR02996 family)
MNDGGLLLRGILEQPDADDARLVYADWLQEHDQEERAEFIRVQIELAALWAGGVEVAGSKRNAKRTVELAARERELFTHRCRKWFPNPSNEEWKWCLPGKSWEGSGYCLFNRGFASHIQMYPGNFLARAASLFAFHPIVWVGLMRTDPAQWSAEPTSLLHELDGKFFWYQTAPAWATDFSPSYNTHWIPGRLCPITGGFRHSHPSLSSCVFFDTAADAYAALSRRCVAHGRKAAGLPPLPEPEVLS